MNKRFEVRMHDIAYQHGLGDRNVNAWWNPRRGEPPTVGALYAAAKAHGLRVCGPAYDPWTREYVWFIVGETKTIEAIQQRLLA